MAPKQTASSFFCFGSDYELGWYNKGIQTCKMWDGESFSAIPLSPKSQLSPSELPTEKQIGEDIGSYTFLHSMELQ
jgi:hypothetical protein